MANIFENGRQFFQDTINRIVGGNDQASVDVPVFDDSTQQQEAPQEQQAASQEQQAVAQEQQFEAPQQTVQTGFQQQEQQVETVPEMQQGLPQDRSVQQPVQNQRTIQGVDQQAQVGQRVPQSANQPMRPVKQVHDVTQTQTANEATRAQLANSPMQNTHIENTQAGIVEQHLTPSSNAVMQQPNSTVADMVASSMSQVPQTMQSVNQPAVMQNNPMQLTLNPQSNPRPDQNTAADAVDAALDGVGPASQLAEPSISELGIQAVAAEAEEDRQAAPQQPDPEILSEMEDHVIDDEINELIQDLGPAAIDDGEDYAVIEKEPAYGISRKNRTFPTAFKDHRARVKATFSKMNKHEGVAFTGILFADDKLPVHCVSIGTDALEDSLRDPNSGLYDLVMGFSDFSDGTVNATFDQCLRDISLLAKVINNHDISVTLEKSPVNERQSVQVRTLRVHPGGGIGLHPTQAKALNADFDSDTGTVNMDQSNVKHYGRATSYLIGIDGNPSIDMDFFLIDPIEDDQVEDTKFCMKNWKTAFKWAPNVVDLIFDEYKSLCNAKDDSERTDALRKLIYKIDEIAPIYSPHQPDYIGVSRIFKSIWDFGNARHARSVRRAVADIVDNDMFEIPKSDTHPLVVDWINYVNSVVAGRVPFNSVEFGEFFNKQFADFSSYSDENPNKPSGKNIPFRLVADFCNGIHRTDLINIGDPIFGVDFKGRKPNDLVTVQEMWEVTCAALHTKLMKGAEYLGSHELHVKTQVKDRIFKTIGLPNYTGENDIETFGKWVLEFIEAYNIEMRALNMSNIAIRNGYRIEREKLKHDGINSDNIDQKLGSALVEIFGEIKVGRIFPDGVITYQKIDRGRQNTDDSILPEFAEMSLNRFAMTNRLRFKSETVFDENGKPVKVEKKDKKGNIVIVNKKRSRKEAAKERLQKQFVNPFDILMLIADRRSAKIGHYSERWEEATQQNVNLINDILSFKDNPDFHKYMEDLMDLIYQVSPDMFMFFGMDNPQTFAQSKHGKRLINIGNTMDVDAFRSELVTMTIEWRLNKSSKIRQSIKEVGEELFETPETESSDRLEELKIALNKEYDLIASASPVWDAIVKEIRNGAKQSLFRKFIKAKGEAGGVDSNKSEWELKAQNFWESEEAEEYGTLITFLKSAKIPYSTKMAVLADITRFYEDFPEIHPNHIIGYLAYNPNRFHDGSPYDMDMGIQSELTAVKGSIDSMSSYKNKIPEEINKQHAEFMDRVKSNPIAFNIWLYRMATERNFAVHVDTITAADAIASVFEKGMPDKEKISQQAAVNGFFECVSIQHNGGFYTHLQQTDNKVVNVVSSEQFSYLDLIRVLGNPDLELYVYDEFGTMTSKPMSRSTLCGGNSIEDVIDYLDDNPRISMQIRRHVLGVNSDVVGSANQHRLEYLDPNLTPADDEYKEEQYDEVEDMIFGILSNRPRFFASCCLITPSQRDVGRNISERANSVIRFMCRQFADLAKADKDGLDVNIDEFVNNKLGVTENRIFDILGANDVEGIGAFEPDLEERRKDAHAIYMTFRREIADCIDEIKNSNEIDHIQYMDIDYQNDVEIDLSLTSIRAFQDVIQTIGGSRTSKMLTVEGAETKRNECLKVLISARKERYSTEFSVDGVPTVVTDVENPEDLTLQHNSSYQQKSIAKFLEIKRETGAEKGNAKIKKYGDDGTNSIIKFDKYDNESIELAMDLREQIESAPDRETAVALLAEALIRADEDMGYIDTDTVFVESDYLNRADLMLGDNSEGYIGPNGKPQPFAIRTLEQLSSACRTRIDDSVIYDKKQEEQIAALEEIVSVVGTDRDPLARSDSSIMHDILIDLSIHGISSNGFTVDRARRPRSSSVDRNYTLMYKLLKKFAKEVQGKESFKTPRREAIEKRTRDVFYSLDNDMKDAVRGIAYPKSKKNDEGKWVDGTDWTNVFDLLGRANDPKTIENIIPGPQSMVLFADSIDENLSLLEYCKKYGVTVAIYSKTYPWAGDYANDIIQVGRNLWVIPFFDMKLNGSFAEPVMPAPSQYKMNPSNYVAAFKDTTGEFGPSDAGAIASQGFADRTHVNLQSKQPEIFSMEDLFVNTLKNVPGEVEFSIPTRGEIQKWIVNNYQLENGDSAEIDFGVDPDIDERGFDRAVGRFNIRMREYLDRFYTDTNEFGMLTENIRHDSIIGFVKATINDGQKEVFAPIIPFPPDRSGNRPKVYNITSVGIAEPYGFDPNTNSFFMNWEYVGGIDDQVIKFYEGIGHSNKFVVSAKRMRDRELANGWPLDIAYFHKSVASRLFSSNQRIMTMISAWTAAKIMPEFSYNFALVSGAFPNRPDIRERLAANDMTREDWERELPNIGRFYMQDGSEKAEKINSIVKDLVTKAVDFGTVNPSILLCSRTGVIDGSPDEGELLEPWMTEFETFINSTLAYEDAWLSFMHVMNPRLVPDGLDGDDSKTLFKVEKRIGANDPYGTLVCLVPHFDLETGKRYEVPECVFISPGFFGDTFSGIKNITYNSNNRFLDSLNVADKLTPREQSMILEHGRAGMSHISMNSISVASDNMIEKVKPKPDQDETQEKEEEEYDDIPGWIEDGYTSADDGSEYFSNLYEGEEEQQQFSPSPRISDEEWYQGLKDEIYYDKRYYNDAPEYTQMEQFYDEHDIQGDERRFYRSWRVIYNNFTPEENEEFKQFIDALGMFPVNIQADILEQVVDQRTDFNFDRITKDVVSLTQYNLEKMKKENPALGKLL